MPFRYVLADLLARVPGAVAVVFLDDTGETIDLETTEYSAEELKVFGAYFGISLRHVRSFFAPTLLGEPELIHLRQGGVNVHAVCLPDEYYVVLLQSSAASTGIARRLLMNAVTDLERELFT